MASTPVEIQAPSGRTLTLELYPLGSDTIANTGGDSLTENTNRKGFYQATVTESLTGWHQIVVKDGSTAVANGYIYLTDTTDVHRTEAPPWSVLAGLVVPEVDLVDAPNETAIEAIQSGLSTFDPTTESVTVEAIEEDAIDAEAIAADAVTAIQSGLATASALSTADGKIDGIKAVTDALPDAGALSSLATATALQIVDDNVDAIKAVTDNLPDSGALSSLATASALATVDNVVDAILEDTGTTLPSSLAGIEDKIDAVDSVADSIKAVTDQLPDSGALTSLAAKTDLPANFADLAITATTGRVTVGTNADKTGYSLTSDYDAAKTAAKPGDEMALTTGALTAVNAAADQALADYDPPTKTQLDAAVAPLATSVELAAVDAKIDTVDGIADAILAAVGTDGVAISSATMQAIADALLDRANAIDGATPRAALRYIAAVLAGKVSGAGTGIETFYGLDGTMPRLEATIDVDGNRTSIEYDPTP